MTVNEYGTAVAPRVIGRGLGETINLIREANRHAGLGENVEAMKDNAGLSGILNAVDAVLRQHVHFTTPEQSWAVALWVAHTYALAATDTSPRLAIRAPTRQSGKTRLLEVLAQLCHETWSVLGPSEAAFYRKIERDHPTVLLDEVDRLFEKHAEDVAGIVGVINAGHTRGAKVPRVTGVGASLTVKDFDVFTPLALAGIGTNWGDTIMDRAIVITLERKTADEPVKPFRRRAKWMPEAIGAELAEALADVGYLTFDHAPDVMSDRQQDSWEPLFAIAELAGRQWPARARQAAIALSSHATKIADDDERIEVQCLADIVSLITADTAIERYGESGLLRSSLLVEDLRAMESRPWGDWPGAHGFTTHALAKTLRPLDIRPHSVFGSSARGYHRDEVMAVAARVRPR